MTIALHLKPTIRLQLEQFYQVNLEVKLVTAQEYERLDNLAA